MPSSQSHTHTHMYKQQTCMQTHSTPSAKEVKGIQFLCDYESVCVSGTFSQCPDPSNVLKREPGDT